MSSDIVLVSSGYDQSIRFWFDFANGNQCKYAKNIKIMQKNALEMTPSKDNVAFSLETS